MMNIILLLTSRIGTWKHLAYEELYAAANV